MKKLLLINCIIINTVLCDISKNRNNDQESAYKLIDTYSNKTNGHSAKPLILHKNSSSFEILHVSPNISLDQLREVHLNLLKKFEYLKNQPNKQNLYNEFKTIVDNAYSLLKHYKIIDETLTERSTPYEILGVSANASKAEINKAFENRIKQIGHILKEPNQLPNGQTNLTEYKTVSNILQNAYNQAIKGKR